MHGTTINRWQHDHTFAQHQPRPGERRTVMVLALTLIMMVVEIAAGIIDGSMALLADGLHMGSHAVALGISAVAYVYIRRHAGDTRFSFGTGKINALAGFSSAILLVVFTVAMAWESVWRLFNPVTIVFNQAIAVAVLGLVVNAVSVVILGGHHTHGDHAHAGDEHPTHNHPTHNHRTHIGHDDHNLRSAYLHVLADALTSVLAICALLAGKWFGFNWMDPVMGVAGALLVARWSWGLLGDTGRILLDWQAPPHIHDAVKKAIESQDHTRVADLHIWSIGPNIYSMSIALDTPEPKAPEHYAALVPSGLGLVHATIEVHPCRHP